MKPIRARRFRLHLFLGACMVAFGSTATMARATTIDFETPSLNGADEASISPLEIQGVQFIGLAIGSLVRESAFFPCDDLSATNQAYEGWVVTWGCIEGCCPSQLISIGFPGPPAEPVRHLALEARSSYGPLFLRTYDAAGNRNETSIDPAPVACSMARRGTLDISTATPIVAAEVWSGNRLPDGCCDGCISFGYTIVIDNVTFDGGAVPTTPATWGRLKVLYR
jgi:hypothetical protein